MQLVRKLTGEIVKGSAGPLTVRSADVGIDMIFETNALQPFESEFWACVKRRAISE